MGNIHHLRTGAESQSRLLEQWITQIIREHPDPLVAQRWAELARETARKFPGPPSPSRSEINLDSVSGLSDLEKKQIMDEVEHFISCYFDDVRTQLMSVHSELLKLQKTIAEHEVKISAITQDSP